MVTRYGAYGAVEFYGLRWQREAKFSILNWFNKNLIFVEEEVGTLEDYDL